MEKLEKILIKNKDVTFGHDNLIGIIKNVSESISMGLLESEKSILNIIKLLNTLSYLNEGEIRGMITDEWMYYIITLSDKIATENAHVWITTFNRLHDMYKASYGFTDESGSVGTITLSCYMKNCAPSKIQKDKYSMRLVKKLNDFHAHTIRYNINDPASYNFVRAYVRSFSDRMDSRLWTVFIPKIIQNFLVQVKKRTGDDDFLKRVNHFLRGNKRFNGEKIITIDTCYAYISLLATLLFPATLSKNMTVYTKDKPNRFSTYAFFSTSLSYEPVQLCKCKQNRIIRIKIPKGTKFLPSIGIDRKDREITLMPGTTFIRNPKRNYTKRNYMFCDYKVTGTKDFLSDENKKQLFLYMVRSYWEMYNEKCAFPYDFEGIVYILNGILEDIRS